MVPEQISASADLLEPSPVPPNLSSPRRRRRSSSPEASREINQNARRRLRNTTEGGNQFRDQRGGGNSIPREDRPSSPKRQRLMGKDMRHDLDNSILNSNGGRYHGNGSSLSPIQKANVLSKNSHSYLLNGNSTSYTNGSTPVTARLKPPKYHGHNREEITRLIIQGLNDLGYRDTAASLVQESGFELECPSVAAFRHAVLQGEWSEAETLLFGLHSSAPGHWSNGSNGDMMYHDEGLLLAEGANKNELRFKLRRQKYLELLEERDLGNALMVLRQELTPLDQDTAQLHTLSR